MMLILKTPPAVEPVSLEEAKSYLRVDITGDDGLIASQITAARQIVERLTRRALIKQTWEYHLIDCVPAEIRLPLPPLISVDSIVVTDWNEIATTALAAIYDVLPAQDSKGVVRLRIGQVWPGLIWPQWAWPDYKWFSQFVVTFTCGYGLTADLVPGALKQAILMLVAAYYERRGDTDQAKVMASVNNMVFPYRVF